MREIALHILDLIENSLRAQATLVAVNVEALPSEDLLRIVIEDNGTGLTVPPAAALDPFYTTKRGKRTGLGLSLFRAAAESTGGGLKLGPSSLAAAGGVSSVEHPGLRVTVEMGLTHIDRNPLGDLAATLASVVCTNPATNFQFRLRLAQRECRMDVFALGAELGLGRNGGLAVAQHVAERIQSELKSSMVLT